jgi:hypothetical protein
LGERSTFSSCIRSQSLHYPEPAVRPALSSSPKLQVAMLEGKVIGVRRNAISLMAKLTVTHPSQADA